MEFGLYCASLCKETADSIGNSNNNDNNNNNTKIYNAQSRTRSQALSMNRRRIQGP